MPACAVMSEKRIGPDGRVDIEAVSAVFAGCIAVDAAGDEGTPSRMEGLEVCLQLARIKTKPPRKRIEEDLKLIPWIRKLTYGCTGFVWIIV